MGRFPWERCRARMVALQTGLPYEVVLHVLLREPLTERDGDLLAELIAERAGLTVEQLRKKGDAET